MIQINIHQAKTNLSQLIQKALEGEEVVIAKDNKPVVKLIQIKHPAERKIGSAQGKILVAEDFKDIPSDFADYTL
jgi:prevent-host-death family protein